MLHLIEADLAALKCRKLKLFALHAYLDHHSTDLHYSPEIPELVQIQSGEQSGSSRITYRSSSVTTRHDHDHVKKVEAECTFHPCISRKSKEIAAKLPRDRERFLKDKKILTVPAPKDPPLTRNQVTEALVAKIKQMYGSLDNYHKQRRENSFSYKDFGIANAREKEDLKECTFQPLLSATRNAAAPLNNPVEGFEAFLNRLEKAREIKTASLADRKPGCGLIYSGQPTKVRPFSFLDRGTHHVPTRE